MMRDKDIRGKKPGDTNRYQIDYILVKQRYRNSMKNSCSYLRVDANTDHIMVIIRVRIRLKYVHGAKKVQK